MFKHILVPTDGSQLSEESARSAVLLAKEAGARITAFYAKPASLRHFYADGVYVEDTPETIREKISGLAEKQTRQNLDYVERLCQEAEVSCTRLTLTSDNPYEAIIEAATQSRCDLIFMASHGRRGFGSLLLGSETSKVLAHTKIPVLVYR